MTVELDELKSEKARETISFQTKISELQAELRHEKEKSKAEVFQLKNEKESLEKELDKTKKNHVSWIIESIFLTLVVSPSFCIR